MSEALRVRLRSPLVRLWFLSETTSPAPYCLAARTVKEVYPHPHRETPPEVDALVRSPGGKLLLTTPERMADPEFRVFLREASEGVGVSRFVVDEAHCVSQWGHDFRPAYLSLRKALEDVGRPPVLATTATAPPHVRDDILFQLGMEKATIVTTTFDRPNLHYEVIIFHDDDEKMRTLVTLLKKLPRPGIVYCATVKKVEELYESLTPRELSVLHCIARGRSNKEIGHDLNLSEGTVKGYVSAVLAKLGVDDRTQAALLAAKHGLGEGVRR